MANRVSGMDAEVKTARVVGRLAPSPTGALHLGNARSFLLAWLSARRQAGELLLRIEDIDSPRVKPWAITSTIEDLAWLGLDWDAGPKAAARGIVSSSERPASDVRFIQSQRLARYRAVLEQLKQDAKVYPCTCSRSDIANAASAPHDSSIRQLEGQIYPGTCRHKDFESTNLRSAKFAWRWAFCDGNVKWNDQLQGMQVANPLQQLGDFVIAKQDSTPAYQLAVVVDDFDSQVNEVVRGDDLICSTYRQLAILKHLGWPVPKYYHVPLIIGPDGRRLAKRHGDTRLSYLREQGVTPRAILGYLASSLGLLDKPQPIEPNVLVKLFDWSTISLQPTVFELTSGLKLLQSLS